VLISSSLYALDKQQAHHVSFFSSLSFLRFLWLMLHPTSSSSQQQAHEVHSPHEGKEIIILNVCEREARFTAATSASAAANEGNGGMRSWKIAQ